MTGFTKTVSAQNSIGISGKLLDGKNAPVSYATITLLSAADNKVAGGDMSDDNGAFNVSLNTYGKYLVRISALGFTDTVIPNIEVSEQKPLVKLGKITLNKTVTSLAEVKITGERDQMEMSIDKKVFHTDKNITSTGGSATDVLQNIPSVSVDAGGNLSLRGKGNVNLLIDGRPATLLGGDVASALQSLPAASIESVEVITNPSAKYDAQGSTGIINIITKKDKKAGFNGTATLGIGTRGKYNGGVNMNLRNNKWNFSLNSNFRINDNYNRTNTDRQSYLSDTVSDIYSDYQRVFTGWFNSLSAEYTMDKNNVLSLTQNFNLMRFGSEGDADFRVWSSPGDLYSFQKRFEKFTGGPNSSSSNLNFKHKFKNPKEELTMDVTYAFANSVHRQQLTTQTFDNAGTLIYGPVYQNLPSEGGTSSFNAQVDYTTPFVTATGKLDLGAKTQNFWFRNGNNPTIQYPASDPVADPFLRNDYKYYQQTHAAYANFSDQHKQWSYQAGLRMEYAGYSGTVYNSSNKKYTNDFLNPFPSLYLAYQVDKKQQVYLNYTKRTNRPFFMQLIPFINVANALDTTSGNPNLKPEFINNLELAYNLQGGRGNSLTASLYYQYVSNLIQTYTKAYADGTSYSQPQNLSFGATYGLELTDKLQLRKNWDCMLNLNMFQNDIKGTGTTAGADNSGFSWLAKINTTYKLPKGTSVQLMANYESAKPAAQGTLEEVYWIDLALKKTFMDNRATITLNVTDIFNTRKYTTNYNIPVFNQVTYRDRETQIATITFSYRFGKSEGSAPGPKKQRPSASQDVKKDAKERDSNLRSGEDDSGGGGMGGGNK